MGTNILAAARWLLRFPDFRTELATVRIGPDTTPSVSGRSVKSKAGIVAGTVGHGDEVLIADPGALILGAADRPDHPVGVAGAGHRHGAAIARIAARIG